MAASVLAVYVHDLNPYLLRFGDSFGIYWYGFSYLLAFAAAYGLCVYLAKHGFGVLKEKQVGDFIVGVAFFGVLLGGRLGYMLFYDFGEFIRNPLLFFNIRGGGMASHGGILGIMIYTWFYARKHRLSWTGVGDNLVVVAPLGIFFGRIANFINGELYGRVSDVAWAMKFPKELYDMTPQIQDQAIAAAQTIIPSVHDLSEVIAAVPYNPELPKLLEPLLTARHPSQLYAALLEGLLLFLVLWIVRTKVNPRHGVLTGIFFIGYAWLRIVDEFFREPDASLTLGLSRGQFLSLFMILIGAGFLIGAFRCRIKSKPICEAESDHGRVK